MAKLSMQQNPPAEPLFAGLIERDRAKRRLKAALRRKPRPARPRPPTDPAQDL